MNTVYKIVGSICITTYVLGLVTNLVDLNYTQKAVKLTFALYFLTVVLIPLKDIDVNFDEIKYATQNVQNNAEDYVIHSSEQRLENCVKQILDKENISYSDVNVHINEQSDGIYLDYIKIYGVNEKSRAKVEDILELQGEIIFGE